MVAWPAVQFWYGFTIGANELHALFVSGLDDPFPALGSRPTFTTTEAEHINDQRAQLIYLKWIRNKMMSLFDGLYTEGVAAAQDVPSAIKDLDTPDLFEDYASWDLHRLCGDNDEAERPVRVLGDPWCAGGKLLVAFGARRPVVEMGYVEEGRTRFLAFDPSVFETVRREHEGVAGIANDVMRGWGLDPSDLSWFRYETTR